MNTFKRFPSTYSDKEIINRLLVLLQTSTCNLLAVEQTERLLELYGFKPLAEGESWKIVKGGKYYIKKNGTAIFAFIVGTDPIATGGFHIVAAHTDSPCFKLKPNCEIYNEEGLVSLNVEKYGGGILYTWFDRPLSISGRVMLRGENPLKPIELLIDLDAPIATIPHLAIHFNRSVNEGNPLSVQKDMKPVLGYFSKEEISEAKQHGGIIRSLIANYLNKDNIKETTDTDGSKLSLIDVSPTDILDYELNLYPFEAAHFCGVNEEFFQSGRIDDLSMAFAGLEALLSDCDIPMASTRVLALFDNEETGSGTKQGAASPILRHIAQRICISLDNSPESFYRALANSFMISADDAHGWHPNYNEKYDPTNHPRLGGGPVIKINANCKYMTDAHSAAVFKSLCEEAGVTPQYFVNHADVAGGSTLGNISSSQLDIPGVDVGCAIWAMHSACETASVHDHLEMIKVFKQFYKTSLNQK